MWETWVQSLGWEDRLEKVMATHSSILAWRIPWTEEPGSYSPWGGKELDMIERLTHIHTHTHTQATLSPKQIMQVQYAVFKVLWKQKTYIAENTCLWVIQWLIRGLIRWQTCCSCSVFVHWNQVLLKKKTNSSAAPAKERKTFGQCLGNSFHFQTVPGITHTGVMLLSWVLQAHLEGFNLVKIHTWRKPCLKPLCLSGLSS